MSIISTQPLTTLADRYAAAQRLFAEAEAELKAVKALVKAEGKEVLDGQYCTVTLSLSERKTLSEELVATYLTPDEIAACKKTTLVETIRVKAKTPVAVLTA